MDNGVIVFQNLDLDPLNFFVKNFSQCLFKKIFNPKHHTYLIIQIFKGVNIFYSHNLKNPNSKFPNPNQNTITYLTYISFAWQITWTPIANLIIIGRSQ